MIARPEIKLTMLDSTGKKLAFVSQSVEELGLSANIVHARAEEAGQGELRESFDFAVSRAVAAMNILCEYCLPFVRPGGCFVALKGPDAPAETEAAARALRELHGEVTQTSALILPAEEPLHRQVLTIRKKSPTPDKYPRPSAKIAKQPW